MPIKESPYNAVIDRILKAGLPDEAQEVLNLLALYEKEKRGREGEGVKMTLSELNVCIAFLESGIMGQLEGAFDFSFVEIEDSSFMSDTGVWIAPKTSLAVFLSEKLRKARDPSYPGWYDKLDNGPVDQTKAEWLTGDEMALGTGILLVDSEKRFLSNVTYAAGLKEAREVYWVDCGESSVAFKWVPHTVRSEADLLSPSCGIMEKQA